jgi:hypothetical protein
MLSPIVRLVIGVTVLLGIYILMLLYVMGQKPIFVDLLQGFKSRANPKSDRP